MKYRQLPRTDLVLPEVGFGVWTVATNWWGYRTPEEQAALLENALDLGITFFDTADAYGEGYGKRCWPRRWALTAMKSLLPPNSVTISTTRPRASATRNDRKSSTGSS